MLKIAWSFQGGRGSAVASYQVKVCPRSIIYIFLYNFYIYVND